MPGDLKVVFGPEALATRAKDLFEEAARKSIRENGSFVLALSGGSTPGRLFSLLSKDRRLPWRKTHIFWSDERFVPPSDPRSNYGAAWELLLRHIPVPPSQVYPIWTGEKDARAAARGYELEVRRVFRALRRPVRFDLILLGLGADGHTASLFPGSRVVRERRRWVVAPELKKGGARRITFTPFLINGARRLLVLVSGSEKARALCLALKKGSALEVPARVLRPSNGELLWLADRAAARLASPVMKD